jgi:hypothetical protein
VAFNNPGVSDFQGQFFRDFPYGTDPNVSVLAQDIANAFVQTNISINPNLWGDQASYTFAYLLLAAHFLVLNLRAASQGLNGQWNWAQNNKSVAAVSEGFEIPERVKQNPELMAYYKTNYGAQYMNLVWPQLAGAMFTVPGSGGQP